MTMTNYSIVLALFITAVGLAYHTAFILTPSDLVDKRIPAIVAVISWFLIGMASGGLVPAMHVVFGDYIITCIAGICFVVGGAVFGHIVLALTRMKYQNDVSYIANQIYQEKRGEDGQP